MQLGKVENLRVACRALDGLLIPAGAVFGVWRHLGAPVAWRGYVPGRMLRQGCMVASVGGGLCQLSNALYAVALEAGCRIVERHGHSRVVPGSAAVHGQDATLAWNYVDLRFAPLRDTLLRVRMDGTELVVSLFADAPAAAGTEVAAAAEVAAAGSAVAARSCGTCGEAACRFHRREHAGPPPPPARRAALLDEAWPEFDVAAGAADLLVRAADVPWARLRRSLATRRAATPAAKRAAALLATAHVARRLARRLTPEVTELVVAQSLLPFLWRDGHLGGRAVTVLMTRLPAAALHDRLDRAAEGHPGRASLTDFRAPGWFVQAEAAALAMAAEIVTPHPGIAALFGERAQLVPWRGLGVEVPRYDPAGAVGFAGPTAARKGAYEMRAAARALDLEVVPLGAELEGAAFWQGVRRAGPGRGVAVLVQPAFVEDRPRLLLAALAADVPVIATPECGIAPRAGLTLVPAGEPGALIAALEAWRGALPHDAGHDRSSIQNFVRA